MPNHVKFRLLVALTAISVAIIVVLWIWYVNWTFGSPTNTPKTASTSDIFKAGLSVIGKTIEIGFVNSYIYFHDIFTNGKTIIVEP